MIGPSGYREGAQKALLDLFAATTRMPVVLYEVNDGQVVVFRSETFEADIEPYCQFIQTLAGGPERCEADECARALRAIDTSHDELTLCHAGLYVQVASISVNGKARAAVLFGKTQIQGDEYHQASLERHGQAMEELGADTAQAAELRQMLLRVKKRKLEQLETLKDVLPRVQGWFYAVEDRLERREDQLERRIEDVGHELQTSLQAVLANAENLAMEAATLRPEGAQKMANEIVYSTLALDRVVQTLGEYLEEYDFHRQSIAPLLEDAIRIYNSEAERRGVAIHLLLHPVEGRMPALEVSSSHLQRALNNLVHNAIKYSFRGNVDRGRYVRIEGSHAGEYYALTFENYGVGILPEEIERGDIFREGYQGKLTTGEYRAGAGKGLHFVKQIVDRHQGHIEVESKLMAGEKSPYGEPHLTRLTVYLPYKLPRGG